MSDVQVRTCIDQLISATQGVGARFWRFRLRTAIFAEDFEMIERIDGELAQTFLAPNSEDRLPEFRDVASLWIINSNGHQAPRLNLLLQACLAVVGARRMPVLGRALELFTIAARIMPDGFLTRSAS